MTIKDHESRLQASFEADMWRDVPAALESLLARGKLPFKPFKSFRKKAGKLKDGE